MRVLVTTFGSYGDLHPYLAIGRELNARGHHVTIATSAIYRGRVEAEGFHFHPVRPDVDLADLEFLKQAFDPYRGSEAIVRGVCRVVRETYADTVPAAATADLILTHPLSYAAVAIAQQRQIPFASTLLSPISFFSVYDPPVPAPAPWLRHLRVLGPALLRVLFSLAHRKTLGWAEPLLQFRRELGLSNSAHPLFAGMLSPTLVLALFSRQFAQPQPDWLPHTVTTGFPFFDQPGASLPPAVEAFLSAGEPPVVFTLGSLATLTAGDFYRSSFEAIRWLGRRALFLTGPHAQGLPDPLPSSMLAIPYAPHEQVFPRASAIVHPAGIGTAGQALRAGKPMLMVPIANDQFDNAYRLRNLGLGLVLPRARFNAARASAMLRKLEQPGYAARATQTGEAIRSENGTVAAVDAIEASFAR